MREHNLWKKEKEKKEKLYSVLPATKWKQCHRLNGIELSLNVLAR